MYAWHVSQSPGRIELDGELRIDDASAIWLELEHEARTIAHDEGVEIDVAKATAIDGTIAALIVQVRAELLARGVRAEIVGANDSVAAIVHLYGGDRPPLARAAVRATWTQRFAAAIDRRIEQLRRTLDFIGELVAGFAAVLRHPTRGGWRELPSLIARTGTDGIAIVLVLDFLVGFVMAFQSTRQLRNFGASVYVADIVGIAMTRELAPLITAIIVSGRSGAGFAAELGTMCVSEEIDALRTMGFAPVPYLVIPRVVTLAVVAPALVLLGDIAGVLGGLVVGTTSLGVDPHAYLAQLRAVVISSDVWTGLVKSVAFGIAIAIIGCQQGLQTRGAASGVGRSTTTTVVICLFTLVALDTALTMAFRSAGL